MIIAYSSGILVFTTTQMLIALKLISFAYNYFDGTYDKKRVFGEHSDPKVAKMYADRRRFAITSLPNPLEFYGYAYCFTCLLAGPAFEYTDYVNGIDLPKTFPKSVNTPSPSLSSTMHIALRKFTEGILCLALHLTLSAQFKISTMYTDDFIKTYSIPYRLFYAYLAIVAQRCRFYFAWKIAEGTCVMSGFDGVEIVDIMQVETATSLQSLTRHWNKRTQRWLERYVYLRTESSLFATYFISAIWHGPYPGFIMFFLSVPLITLVERQIRCKINLLLMGNARGADLLTFLRCNASILQRLILSFYCLICWVCLTVEMVYLAHLFIKLPAHNLVAVMSSFYYLGHLIPVFLYMVLYSLPIPKSKIKIH